MNTQLSKILLQLNLNTKQAAVYETILLDKRITVSDICRKLGTNRIFVYRTIEELVKLGLLETAERDIQGFKITNPNVVLSLLQQKQYQSNKAVSDFQEYLPEILTNWYGYNEPVFKTYSGKDKFLLLFNNLLEVAPENCTIYMFSEGNDFIELIDINYWANIWLPKRIKKNISALILPTHNNSYFNSTNIKEEYLRNWKFLPPEFNKMGSLWVVNDIIILWDTVNAKAFEIRNKTMAEFLKGVFTMTWNSLK